MSSVSSSRGIHLFDCRLWEYPLDHLTQQLHLYRIIVSIFSCVQPIYSNNYCIFVEEKTHLLYQHTYYINLLLGRYCLLILPDLVLHCLQNLLVGHLDQPFDCRMEEVPLGHLTRPLQDYVHYSIHLFAFFL